MEKRSPGTISCSRGRALALGLALMTSGCIGRHAGPRTLAALGTLAVGAGSVTWATGEDLQGGAHAAVSPAGGGRVHLGGGGVGRDRGRGGLDGGLGGLRGRSRLPRRGDLPGGTGTAGRCPPSSSACRAVDLTGAWFAAAHTPPVPLAARGEAAYAPFLILRGRGSLPLTRPRSPPRCARRGALRSLSLILRGRGSLPLTRPRSPLAARGVAALRSLS